MERTAEELEIAGTDPYRSLARFLFIRRSLCSSSLLARSVRTREAVEAEAKSEGRMPNQTRGRHSDIINSLLQNYIAVNNTINELTLAVLEGSSSSDDDEFIPRPMYTRSYTGRQYVLDVLTGHPVRSYNCFRLPSEAFVQLRDLLVGRNLLTDTKNMSAAEQIGVFLRGVAHAHSYRQLCEFFQHSLETISRHFNNVLQAIVTLSLEFITLPPTNGQCHPHIRGNAQFNPFFENAIGAIDGTHIPAIVSRDLQNKFRNRKGFTSQNVMAAVSFDRQFVYIASGWEGSAADMRVLRWAVEGGGFTVPEGRFYLVDSGYANTDKFLAPFRGYRYHLNEYRGGGSRRYNTAQELYNHRHAQLRNIVERTFGIWKERFQVLTHMRQHPISAQADIVIACAVLHNFIGRYHGNDIYFNMSQTEMEHDSTLGEVPNNDDDPSLHTMIGERVQGESIRSSIANNMWASHVSDHRRRNT